MYFISHRGNINGKNPNLENTYDYIVEALLLGYDVEIDLWNINGDFYLGHDYPSYHVNLNDIIKHKNKLWVHCKNNDCMSILNQKKIDLNYFWHESDSMTMTSKNFLWLKENEKIISNSIVMIPCFYEINDYNFLGICSDEIKKFKNYYEKTRC